MAATVIGDSVVAASVMRVRLGRVERDILQVLRRSGPVVPRDALLRAVFPTVRRSVHVEGPTVGEATASRALAEASLSRAIGSLQRKGLLVRDRQPSTGRTQLRVPGTHTLPAWELQARAEDDLAAQNTEMAKRCRALAAKARMRADDLRAQQRVDPIREEGDLHGSACTPCIDV